MIPANPAVHSFGFETVCAALVRFCRAYPDSPLVSVGCGMAATERAARAQVSNAFFLVDPAPMSYYPGVATGDWHRLIVEHGMPPTHSYTEELVQSEPRLVDTGCILLLNWCDYGDTDDYDLRAVVALRPRAIFTVIDVTGSAGSAQFHAFLRQQQTIDYRLHRRYCIRHTATADEAYACSHETIEMQWLVSTNSKHDGDAWQDPAMREIYECQQAHDETNKQNIKTLESRASAALEQPPNSVAELVLQMIKMGIYLDDVQQQ